MKGLLKQEKSMAGLDFVHLELIGLWFALAVDDRLFHQ